MQKDIEFKADDGIKLRGWLKLPSGTGPFPTVVMTHGAGGYKEWFLPGLSDILAEAGIASLAYDHRNFGDSEGEPRCEIDPQLQVRDYRTAITFAGTLPEVDRDRVGIFGTSFSGAHVLVVGAIDRRVKCIVSQVPFISGSAQLVAQFHPEEIVQMRARWDEDRLNRLQGKSPATVPHYVADPNNPVAGRSANRVKFFLQMTDAEKKNWKNLLTLRSMEALYENEAGAYIPIISPTPVLMIISQEEAQLGLPHFERAMQPKKLILTRGGHYDPYMDEYSTATNGTRDWFVQWLRTKQ